MNPSYRLFLFLIAALVLSGCGVTRSGKPTAGTVIQAAKTIRNLGKPASGGGYYKDDGPANEIPVDLDAVPNAVPKHEPLYKPASKPYEVLGKKYVPQTEIRPFRQEGVASWYGRKFHGQKTSIGDTYDMFAMTAAHPTLPLPSYVRVTNPANERAVVVRVNDRGPFHAGRILDLSYVAAYKLGYVNNGSARVIVETIFPGAEMPSAILARATPAPASAAMIAPPPPTSTELDTLAQQLMIEADPPSAATPPVSTGNIFLQLGAFANAENAETLKARLMRELDWIADPLRVASSDNLHRLQLGPYADRPSAERIAQRIQSELGFSPAIVIAPKNPDSTPPVTQETAPSAAERLP
ncbi:MAG: septal ring lytic transglycosylase RlpA family protein [Zoogloeaceae bacterium]|jgi:rare lipoprotein A|nr:septal ring lytic transglycosylase RlpA family protein [Zoogloeaceae bacterium]